jgi:hypothetical protein
MAFNLAYAKHRPWLLVSPILFLRIHRCFKVLPPESAPRPADQQSAETNRFSQPRKKPELLLPDGISLRWSGWIAKDQRRRLDEERLVGFNRSADLSHYPRKISVRTNRATTAGISDDLDWPDNENRVHGKRYRRINGRH